MLLKKTSLKIFERKYRSETNSRIKQRLQILLLLRERFSQREVAKMVRVSSGLVPFWKKRFELEGFIGIKDKAGRGVKPQITNEQLSMLRTSIEEPIPLPDGYSRGWKSKDVRIFIKNNFGLSFTRQHICRILHLIKCSIQVPRPRNKRRNQESVDEFKREFKKKEMVWVGV